MQPRARLRAASVALALLGAGCWPSDSAPAIADATPFAPDADPLAPDAPPAPPDALPAPDAPPAPVCGDGVLQAPEACDDGDVADGDGCSAACAVEPSACGGTLPFVLEAGATVAGSTDGAPNAASGPCGGAAAGEQVLVFALYAPADVTLSTALPATGFDTALYVRARCTDPASLLGCESAGTIGDTLILAGLEPGTYFVFVDGVAGASGAFAISAAIRPIRGPGAPCDPSALADRCADGLVCHDAGGGPTCASAAALCAAAAPVVTPGVDAPGSTVGAPDGYATSCSNDGAAGERVFQVTVPAGHDLLASVSATSYADDAFDPILSVDTVCGDPTSSLACEDSPTASQPETAIVLDAEGTYFLVVDGYDGAAGEFAVTVTLRPVRGAGDACDPAGVDDRCGGYLACLPDPVAGGTTCLDPYAAICGDAPLTTSGAVVTGTLAAATSELRSACAGGGGGRPEAIWAIDLASAGFLTARETGGAMDWGATLYVRGPGTCAPDGELACDTLDGGLAVATPVLAPGRYYVVLDGTGDYQLAILVAAALAEGDPCDPASTSARCAPGTWCVGSVCQVVAELTDIAPNADFCDAQGPIAGDTVVSADLTGPLDWDTFQLDLPAGAGALALETSDGLGGCAADTVLEVFGPPGADCAALDAAPPAPLAADDDSAVSPCSRLELAALAPGVYYVRVTHGGGATGTYSLLMDLP